MSPRERLHGALAAGRDADAARLAARLAHAGSWDATVAATLYLHGPAAGPHRDRAAACLAVLVASARVAHDPSRAAWDELLAALVDAGRARDALVWLERAADAGQVELASHLGLVVALFQRGDLELAWGASALAVSRFPDDGRAWATVAFLAVEVGDDALAERAGERALEQCPGLADALLTLALVAARGGDEERAEGLLVRAAGAGVPSSIVEGYRRLLGATDG